MHLRATIIGFLSTAIVLGGCSSADPEETTRDTDEALGYTTPAPPPPMKTTCDFNSTTLTCDLCIDISPTDSHCVTYTTPNLCDCKKICGRTPAPCN